MTVHPWDTAVDELVILGDHVTTDSGTGIVHTAPGFGEDDYHVGVANGLEVAVTVNERGIMMENAGPDFEGQFYDKVAYDDEYADDDKTQDIADEHNTDQLFLICKYRKILLIVYTNTSLYKYLFY